jgi:hypothetical protein
MGRDYVKPFLTSQIKYVRTNAFFEKIEKAAHYVLPFCFRNLP